MKKEKCTHIKIPLYDEESKRQAAFLNALISNGENKYYVNLTWLAVTTVAAGKFYRETCEKCNGLSSSSEDQKEG